MYPDTFIKELNARCDVTGQRPYRYRQNDRLGTFMIEQKVSRATEIPPQGDDFASSRVRDGYALVIEGHRYPYIICPECEKAIALPVLKKAEVRCTYCNDRPSHERQLWFAGYYPLCDTFLTALERTAPKMDGKWLREMEEKNLRAATAPVHKRRASLEAIANDYWKQAAQIQQVGYGNGPASFGVL